MADFESCQRKNFHHQGTARLSSPKSKTPRQAKIIEQEVTEKSKTPIVFSVSSVTSCSKVSACLFAFAVKNLVPTQVSPRPRRRIGHGGAGRCNSGILVLAFSVSWCLGVLVVKKCGDSI
jgi:hypothetical protein